MNLPESALGGFINSAYAVTESFSPDADPETDTFDGYVENDCGCSNRTFLDIRDDTSGTDVNDSSTLFDAFRTVGRGSGNFQELRRGYLSFNTSALPDDANITTSSLLFTPGGTVEDNLGIEPDLALVEVNTASTTGVVTGDFNIQNFTTSTELAPRIPFSSLTSGTENEMVFNSDGTSTINKTGTSTYALFNGNYDLDEVAPSTSTNFTASRIRINSADGATDPVLSVTYLTAIVPGGGRVIFIMNQD